MTLIRKLPRNVRDLGKLLLPKALKSCPKSKKLPYLVTLVVNAKICLFLCGGGGKEAKDKDGERVQAQELAEKEKRNVDLYAFKRKDAE